MAQPKVDIEWIVREVIRRLRNGNLHLDNSNGATIAGPQRDAESLELNELVITLSTIENRLGGVRRLVVPRRAVVTPAVVDELKDQGVALVRDAAKSGQQNGTVSRVRRKPLVVVDVPSFDAAALTTQLGDDVAVCKHVAQDDVTSHIEQDNLAVLLTHAPVTAVVTANRNPRVRAAIGYNFPSVRQAVDEAGANLLAIDPSGRSISEIAGMIGEFLRR